MGSLSNGAIDIVTESDIVSVRKAIRQAAEAIGFSTTDNTRIVTATSELCRNVYKCAGSGTMCWRSVNNGSSVGLEIVFEDNGPGIDDIEQAMSTGFTTAKGLGLGLPGAQRLMDEMTVESTPGRGTTVRVVKWMRRQ